MAGAILGNPPSTGGSPAVRHMLVITEMLYQGLGLQRLLAEMDTEATLALGAEAGLLHLSRTSFDVVLLDVDLGEHAVQELAARLRREHRGSRVAVMVGWWDERTPEMQGCCDLLVFKPVDPRQLRTALDAQ